MKRDMLALDYAHWMFPKIERLEDLNPDYNDYQIKLKLLEKSGSRHFAPNFGVRSIVSIAAVLFQKIYLLSDIL